MKRTNVIVDEELLEKARRLTGEKTYSATINKALEEVVRRGNFRRALHDFQQEAAKGGFFTPGYLEEIRPNSYAVTGEDEKKTRRSAHEKRAPRKKSSRRAPR